MGDIATSDRISGPDSSLTGTGSVTYGRSPTAAALTGARAAGLPIELSFMLIKPAPAAHVILLVLGFVLTAPAEALAYVDPGTGSYLFQLAAAGLLAGMFTLRRYWEVLKATFRRGSGSPNHTSSE